MMYRCCECDHVFDESEIEFWSEPRGEYWGVPCSELVSGCPNCRGDFHEAIRCDCCGEYFFAGELKDGLCDDCLNIEEDEEKEVKKDENAKG